MEKLPIFNFSQWVVANGGTVRILDGEFEPVDNIPGGFREYEYGKFSNIEIYKKDGLEKIVQWNPETRRFHYYEKRFIVEEPIEEPEEEQRDIPIEILSLLHPKPEEPLTLTKICKKLRIDRKEGREAIRQLIKEKKVVRQVIKQLGREVIKKERVYTITPEGVGCYLEKKRKKVKGDRGYTTT